MMKKVLLGFVVLAAALGVGSYAYVRQSASLAAAYKTPEEKDVYVRFAMEAYDKIRENFWASTTEAQLADHFQASLQKAEGSPVVPTLSSRDRSGTAKMIASALAVATSTEAKKGLVLNTLIVGLYNLPPAGHGELLSDKQETALRDNVSNVDPNKDLYQTLGIAKGASDAEIGKAFAEKEKELAMATTSEAKAELAAAKHAKDVLSNPNTRDLYDAAKIEPTASTKIMGKTLYIKMDKISPSTFIEFGRTVLSASTTPGLDSMILDLRGNLGGSLDFANNFLGLFLGYNQYAYDLFHQGEYEVQRTIQPKFPELSRYKEIAILTDRMTQSTAEVTTAAMKKFHLAKSVGEPSRGWGTVENTFPLTTPIDPAEKYSLLLVHSLTLRDDNQPIQDRGVDPDVSVQDPNWRKKLADNFRSESLIAAIEKSFGSK